jgi:TetR/AcrR family transcriptional regulator, transcriptional repressor for nem operon
MVARPKEFEEARALDDALLLFWSRGYAATSLADLQASTGLSRSSLYLAFGSKHELFLRCLGHYTTQVGGALGSVAAEPLPARELLARLFVTVFKLTSAGGKNRGCFLGNSALELGDRDPAVRERVFAGLAAVEQVFAQVLRQGVESGELRPGVKPALTAQILTANLHGMLVMAKAGASKKSLNALQAAALSSVTGRSQ